MHISRSTFGDDATELDRSSKTLIFEQDIVPILKAYCWRCHGGEGRTAGLDLRSLPLLLKGGKTGAAIVRGSAEKSLLFQKLVSRKMPPGNQLKPTEAHIAIVRTWIESGAAAHYEGGPLTIADEPALTNDDRDWWAFRKPVRPAAPKVKRQDRVRTAIDAFLLRRLEAAGLNFSPDADRTTWIRRTYLDVIGLPSTPAQVDAFLADESVDTHMKLVDDLLASKHYGERWGRHWLDAAGYVDTVGSDNDAATIKEREQIWRYRDYVVDAFNNDKPYDRFLLEQIAGDELVDWRNAKKFTPEIREALIATGFLRQAPDVTYAPELNTADIRHQVLFDTIQIVSTNVLGLTVQCAQCHTHKFDPISHADYYRLAAIFAPGYDAQNWKTSIERFVYDVAPAEKQQIDSHNKSVDGQVAELNKQIAALRKPFEQRAFESKLAKLPAPIRADTKAAMQTAANKRSAVQKYLAAKLGSLLKVTAAEIDKALDEPAKAKAAQLRAMIAQSQQSKRSYAKIQALWDLGTPGPAYLYRRGDYATPGASVTAGVIAVVDDPNNPFELPSIKPGNAGSGYRTAFARWLAKPDHPLTARVIVNRVWQQYFGRGIVATVDNFGASGTLPTHPELLDWLATEFVSHGWSFKHLHRTILLSTAYRQASARPRNVVARPRDVSESKSTKANPATVDPDNLLLWRMPLRRLESEIVRDSILATSAALDRSLGGPPVPLKPNSDGSVEIDTSKLPSPSSQFRRSLYVFARRNYQLTELNVFDQPNISHNCTRRLSSAVVLQSLAMLNGKFIFDQSRRFAERVRKDVGGNQDKRIVRTFRLALGRRPVAEEIKLSRDLLKKQSARYQQQKLNVEQAGDAALTNLCQMLLNTSEFLYVH